jgi:K+-transporting ATPase ATPase A chain
LRNGNPVSPVTISTRRETSDRCTESLANSAHPFENPTPLTNFLEMFAIFAISAGLTYTLGAMTGSPKHGWAVWGAMAFLFVAGVTTAYWAEARGNRC